MKRTQAGQSIIEIVIATAVVALTLTAIAAGLTFSVKNTAQSKLRSLGTTRAQEGLEVFRRERALLGWTRFTDAVRAGTFCINELPADSSEFIAMQLGECISGEVVAGTEYTREALVDVISDEEVRVEIVVEWLDGSETKSLRVVQEFRKANDV